jgi:hypothetical protein
MGLDMYLKQKIFVGGEYEHVKASGSIKYDGGKVIKATEVSEVIKRVGYWRKANHIHNWFVTNVQGGTDECQESEVSFEQLMELKKACEGVLNDHSKAEELLPTSSGFFFGTTEYDEYYFKDLEDTVEILSKLEDDGEYIYQASW